jgi:hypothetical protein
MTLLEINYFDTRKYYIGPIVDSTIDSYLKYNADGLTSFDIFARSKRGNLEVLVGDGSWEGSGMIYLMNTEDDSLIWFAFFENSEPFESVSFDENGFIHAVSAVNINWKISVVNPLDIELIYPNSAPKYV